MDLNLVRQKSFCPPVEGQALDVIFLQAFTGQTVIGINEDELTHPQPVVIDLYAGVYCSRACTTDDIADTIDYGRLRERLHRLLREHRARLLEAFAREIADLTIVEFGAAWVRVKVVKPKKFGDVEAVGVVVERDARHYRALR